MKKNINTYINNKKCAQENNINGYNINLIN